ncbi:MAG TPA: YtxH domain-containing protein [Chloroflexi bacterium]|nr:YtxH domain-containing protein [Chloroflexota bacterium]
MKKAFSFLLGVVSGAVIGAVAAILLAPYPGSELQARVRTRIQELIEEGRRAAAERRSELEVQLESFKRGTSSAEPSTVREPAPPQ